MKEEGKFVDHLSTEDTIQLILDFFHRLVMHHALWYAEVQHQLGSEKAKDILKKVYEQSFPLQIKRMSKTFGFEIKDGLPVPLLELPLETLIKLKETIAANWLANDGIWFQSLEFSRGMDDAKRCNDSCWAQFSPFEAWSIKRFLNLPEKPGLDGLKKALEFRLYAAINRQSIKEETDNSFTFQMNDCRVQSTRNRKGLPDYPCKSAGIVEYTTFAESIDSRIKTECISCPPDKHPQDWYCSWLFFME